MNDEQEGVFVWQKCKQIKFYLKNKIIKIAA